MPRRQTVLAHVASSLSARAGAVTATTTAEALTATTIDVTPRPEDESDPPLPLTEAQVATFLEEGHCVLPGIIPQSLSDRICAEHDREAAARASPGPNSQIVSFEELGKLCSLPMVVEKVKQLMGAYGNGETACAMHHIHANRQLPGTGSSNWHQVRGCSLCRAASYAVGLNRSDGGGDADRYAGL
jgi:hypothetical protein